jgi:hypothetical protein
LKKDKSWVQFTLICFTDNGAIDTTTPFKTEKIPITEAEIDIECNALSSFKMASTNWYPTADANAFKFEREFTVIE